MAKPTASQLEHIARQIIGKSHKSGGWIVQRCPARSFKLMRQFELNGDFSHSGQQHVCPKCQCTRKAGEGTKGEFWGDGPEWHEVGHYGVGFCGKHEYMVKGYGIDTLDFARKHREALQGAGKLSKHDPKLVAKHNAEVSKRQLKLVQNMEKVQEKLEEFIDYMNSTKKFEDRVIAAGVDEMNERFDDFDFNEHRDRKKFKQELSDLIMSASHLTESAGGRIIPMTDKTKIDALRNLAKDVSKLNLDEYRMGKDSYVHVDEVRQRVPRMLTIFEQTIRKIYEFHLGYDQEKDNFKEFLDDLTQEWIQSNVDMWSSLKTGR